MGRGREWQRMEEDSKTREALDELADLFLTGPSQAGAGPRPRPSHASETEEATPAPPSKPAPTASTADVDDPLTGPRPVRLAPKPALPASRPPHFSEAERGGRGATRATERPGPRSGPAMDGARADRGDAHEHNAAAADRPRLRLHRDDDPEDVSLGQAAAALLRDDAAARRRAESLLDTAVRSAIERGEATMRDTRTRAGSAGSAAARPAAAVEAVLLGNLPGLSGPWLTQYAQIVAQHEGPVAVLHVDDERIDVEVIEPTDRPQSSGRVPPGRGERDLVDRLEALVRGPNPVRMVLVHVEPATRAASLARLRALDDWTLICGADDAAIVGAYRLLKQLVDADASMSRKRVGLMIMGSDPAEAEPAAKKLIDAAESFLDTPVELVGCQQQMMPVNLRQIGRFGPTEALWPRLCAWFDGLAEPAPPCTGEPVDDEPEAAPMDEVEMDELAEADDLDERTFEPVSASRPPHFSEAERGVRGVTERARGVTERPGPRSGPAMKTAPKREAPHREAPKREAPATTSPAADADTDDEPNLAHLLTTGPGAVAGGVALEARCPHQPQTQLLLDEAGRLHLLRRVAVERTDDASPITALRAAVVDLLEARRWVREHLQLLQLTQRQCRFDPAAEPTLHLFTDRADLATGLVARLGSTLRLHLLQSVRVGDQSTWFCTPLN